MEITKQLLKDWGACSDGFSWFIKTFPQSASYAEVNSALRAEKRYGDSSWLVNKVYSALLQSPEQIAAIVDADVKQTLADVEGSPNISSGDGSTSASSGDYSTSASSGDYSTSASSGNGSTSASSGNGSKSASSGDYSKSASSGNGSKSASSGDYSTSASSGDYSTSEAKGAQTIAMVAGLNGKARAGEQGAFALAWKDGGRMRIAVGVVGENDIKADVWYCVSGTGELQETD